jgi:hypothetical protein
MKPPALRKIQEGSALSLLDYGMCQTYYEPTVPGLENKKKQNNYALRPTF